MKIYHVSTWSALSQAKPGDTFILKPGTQNAEGAGVYFSETESVRAADSVYNGNAHTVTVVIESGPARDWFRSKKANLKGDRARTWHSRGKSLKCQVEKRHEHFLECSFEWEKI